MQEVLGFPRSDGDPSHWPVCGKAMDGKRWQRLESDNDSVAQYLDKLSAQLSDIFDQPHTIRTLPEGYALFIRYSMKGSRQDRYLIGSPHAKSFRSPAEFAPHAFWLLSDPSLVNSNCLCKYCSKNQTRSVRRSESVLSGPIAPVPPSRAQRVSRTSSSLTRTSQPSAGKEARRLFRVTEVPPGLDPREPQPILSDIDSGSLYRKGEIVWLTLNNPVMLDDVDGAADGFIIRFWPSIVEMDEICERPLAIPYYHGTSTATPLRVRFLTSGMVYDVPRHEILPFWAHSPDELWLQRLRLQTKKSISSVQDPFAGFDRVFGSPPAETSSTFDTGDLLFHFLSDVGASLELTRTWSTTPMTLPPLFGVNLTQIQPLPSTTPSTYRELWWGAERITLGDLIRLRIRESGLPGLGVGQTWFAPRTLPESSMEATPFGDSGTEEGQLFFKLRSLKIVAGINGKELHGFGGLYRLVPIDPGLLPPFTADQEHKQLVLPCPPEGFAFQPMLRSGWEIELSLHHIDGRYYPRIQSLLPEPSGVDVHILEALEGIICWQTTPLRPLYFKKGSREEITARIISGSRKLIEGRSPQG